MNNNVAVLTVAFRAQRFIKANTEQFKKNNLLHLVVEGVGPWRGTLPRDRTFMIAARNGAYVMTTKEKDDASQRNDGLEWLRKRGYEWALVVDSDEFWTQENINKLLGDLTTDMDLTDDVDVITAPNMHVYWKDWNHRIHPDPQPDNPIVAIRTDQKFSWSRLSDAKRRKTTEAEFHHLSYVRTNDEIQEKILTSEHAHEIYPNWYDSTWRAWEDGMRNLHPVIPEIFAYTTIDPVPEEIKDLFC